jgi:hypothetical protein
MPHLLGRHVEGDRPEVDLPVGVDARDDEEDAGTLGAAFAQPAEAEDDGTLVLLDNLEQEETFALRLSEEKIPGSNPARV